MKNQEQEEAKLFEQHKDEINVDAFNRLGDFVRNMDPIKWIKTCESNIKVYEEHGIDTTNHKENLKRLKERYGVS